MSSFGSFHTGVSGLNVSQAALNVTAHNLANLDTKGFVRQQVVLTDAGYIKWGQSYVSPMKTGLGAEFATLKQIRDGFLDQAYRQETGRQAFYASQYKAVEEVEGLFGELEGVSFQRSMNDLWVSLQELVNEPDNIVARSALIQTSVTFVERASNISKQLNDYQLNLNTQILNQIQDINSIGDKIKTLNIRIRHYESTDVEKANDLRDQRNLLLDQLSRMADITYKEDSNGVVDVTVEGVPFVTQDMVYYMAAVKVDEDTDMLKPVWLAHGNMDVFNFDRETSSQNNNDIGSLKGLLLARGHKQARYTDIPVREDYTSESLFNMAHLEYNKRTDASVITTVQAQFDQLIHGMVTTINDVLAPNKEVTLVDEDGQPVQTRWILDEEKAPVGMDSNRSAGQALFNRKSMERYSEQEIVIVGEDGNPQTIMARVYNLEDPSNNYSLFTIGEIEVNQKIMQDYSLLPLSSNDGTGEYDMETARELLLKWQEPFASLSPNTLTENNFNDYYTSFISEIANRGEKLRVISSNQASMVDSIDNKRMQVTGVSSDEELTNLIKYQHAYNAAARYVNVVSEMLEHIILNM